MKSIQVTDFTPAPGMEYLVTGYPGNGAYLSNTGLLAIVFSGCIYTVPGGAMLIKDAAPDNSASNQSGASENFILKALAIAQNPQLAVELAK